MRNVLLRNTVMAFLLTVVVARAHTTNMTTITMALAEDGSFEMVVQLDPGEKMLGYQRYFEISRMEEPERNRALAPITQAIEKELRLSFDGGRVLLQSAGWTLPNAPYESFIDPTFPTMSQLRLRGVAPARAERLDFVYPSTLELPLPVLFRVDKVGERLPFSRVVDGPAQPMRPITLLKPPPPLLNERELVAAARVVHGARAFYEAYGRALQLRWETTLLPFILCLAFVLIHGARQGWLRWHLTAAILVGTTFWMVRRSGMDVSNFDSPIEMGLAAIAIAAGGLAAMRLGNPGAFAVVGVIAAVMWAIKVAEWRDQATSPVLTAETATLLHAVGYGAAWMVFGFLAKAVLYQVKQTQVRAPAFGPRTAPVLGMVLAGSGAYWIWQAM